MKELTIEQKSQRYDEAIEKAKEMIKAMTNIGGVAKVDDIQYLFPELKESEDERIRKQLLNWFKDCKWDAIDNETLKRDDIIAWLEAQGEHANFRNNIQIGDKVTRNEAGILVNISQLDRVAKKRRKQGEQKFGQREECFDCQFNYAGECKGSCTMKIGEQNPIDNVEPFDKFGGLTDFERTLSDICIGWIGGELGWKQYIKDNADVLLKIAIEKFNSVQDVPFEQKPAWSEEDDYNAERLLCLLTNQQDNYPQLSCDFQDIEGIKDWVKSLKDRRTLLPSDEQMNALHDAAIYVDKSMFPYPKGILMKLYEQLKKLK